MKENHPISLKHKATNTVTHLNWFLLSRIIRRFSKHQLCPLTKASKWKWDSSLKITLSTKSAFTLVICCAQSVGRNWFVNYMKMQIFSDHTVKSECCLSHTFANCRVIVCFQSWWIWYIIYTKNWSYFTNRINQTIIILIVIIFS